MLNIAVCATQGFAGTVSYTGYQCRGSAAADTDFLLSSTLDKWGVNGTLRISLLKRAASQVQADCPDCSAILEQEAHQPFGSGGGSPIVWIVVFLCLIGGVLTVALLRKKDSDAPPPTSIPPATAQPSAPEEENPLEIARARYARGDITRAEFEEITAALGHPGWSPKV